jgi:hypothetical protein
VRGVSKIDEGADLAGSLLAEATAKRFN